ncbi:MAG: MBL fold metallo-hydrolase [Desulfuromonadales bacterium]|nr:MBL fold metallo-hydrolase [Desulfuromonadales bacterium]
MKLTFLGTRGYIETATPRHRRHSLLQVASAQTRVLIDCGEDWLGELASLRPDAIFLTHAHPDHAWGLQEGAPCPVFATAESWELLADYPLAERRTVLPREPVRFGNLTFEPFPLQHSIRAPAVGYRISEGEVSVFYAPDVVYIAERAEALQRCRLYIGDGATVRQSFVRKEGDQLFGHTPVMTQLTWCRKEGVAKMLVTHCGEEIVTGEEKGVLEEIAALARARQVEVEVAWDGMEVQL